MYEYIHKYRNNAAESDGIVRSNRYLAKGTWAIASMVVAVFVMVLFTLVKPAPDGSVSWSSSFIWVAEGIMWAWIAWAFFGSLVLPARRLEEELDQLYPDYSLEPLDYRFLDDVAATLLYTIKWTVKAIIAFAVFTLTLTMLELLTIVLDQGVPLSADQVAELTVFNSVALVVVTVIVAGFAFYKAAENMFEKHIDEIQTAANNALVIDDEDRWRVDEGAGLDG